MAELQANNAYLSWNGVDLSGYWTGETGKSETVNLQEVTHGAGATHVMRGAGLIDNSFSFSIIYDVADIATYDQDMAAGTEATLIYGPEGSTAGKPKFQCTMILESVDGPNVTIDKSLVQFDLSFSAAAAPTATIAGGDTF